VAHPSTGRHALAVFIAILSEPELFIKGNHRTGALAVNYILARDGCPPFVLSVENAQAYLDPSSLITSTRKHRFDLMRVRKLKRYFAKFLKEQPEQKYLIAGMAGRVEVGRNS
jgi:hypothetical protein